MNQMSNNHEDPRLAEILEILLKFATGDLAARGTLAGDGSALDGVMASINNLGEALETKESSLQLTKELAEQTADEQELHSANEQLSVLLDSLPIAVYRCTAEGDYAVAYMSQNVVSFTGYTARNFMDQSDLWFSRIHPDDVPGVLDEVELLLEKGWHVYEYRWRKADGNYLWIRDSLRLVRFEDDTPNIFVGMWQDITEDTLAAEALQKANDDLSLYRKLLDSSSDAIEVVDPTNLRYLDVNETTCRTLGYSREELLTMSVHDIDPNSGTDVFQKFEEKMRKSGTARFETSHRRKDGSTFPVEVSMGAVTLDKLYGLAIVRDITKRKQVEEKIRRLNEELEDKFQKRTQQLLDAQEDLVRKEKLAMLGQVVGSVGHELRNPLGVMNNAVYFLQTVLTDADETTREYLEIIKTEIDDAERIVSDLLDSVRIKPPQPSEIGVRALIDQTLHKGMVPAAINVTLDIPETLPRLRVDARQIQQVFRNLISNGMEAMPEGELTVEAVGNRQEGTVTVKVRDNGKGIAPEMLDKLFQPLITTKARGIGLGLVVVKNLTEANGGTIMVESVIGQGTTFTLVLPTINSFIKEG